MTQFQAISGIVVSSGLFTQSLSISCDIRMRQGRLTDYLNSIEEQFITVEQARLANLAGGGAPTIVAVAQVNRDSVIFAIPYSGESGGAAQDQRRLVTVTKVPRRVIISAPPFSIQGDMHLLRETGLRDALLAVRQPFMPLTSAEVVHLPTGQRLTAATLIVSRRHVDVFSGGQDS